MGTFVLVPGAGGSAWYWHLVQAELAGRGHEAVAVDLPGDDPAAGLEHYRELTLQAIGDRTEVVLVAQSLGGFTAALVAQSPVVRRVVLVNAMVPVPGETPGAWWDNTGAITAREAAAERDGYATEFDPWVHFLHDVPPALAAEGEPHQRDEAPAVFGSTCDFRSWPGVPIHVVAGADDRFFPVEFQRATAADRLGREVDVLPGGHLMALSRPVELTEYLLQAAGFTAAG